MRHYERIQDHIFRLLATDQVPRFIRSPKMTELMAAAAVRTFCSRRADRTD